MKYLFLAIIILFLNGCGPDYPEQPSHVGWGNNTEIYMIVDDADGSIAITLVIDNTRGKHDIVLPVQSASVRPRTDNDLHFHGLGVSIPEQIRVISGEIIEVKAISDRMVQEYYQQYLMSLSYIDGDGTMRSEIVTSKRSN